MNEGKFIHSFRGSSARCLLLFMLQMSAFLLFWMSRHFTWLHFLMCVCVCNFVYFMGYACWHCPAALTDLGYRRAKTVKNSTCFIFQPQRGATGIGWTRPKHFLPTLTFPYSTSFPFTPSLIKCIQRAGMRRTTLDSLCNFLVMPFLWPVN